MSWVWALALSLYPFIGIGCSTMARRIAKEELYAAGFRMQDIRLSTRIKLWLIPFIGWPWLMYRYRKGESRPQDEQGGDVSTLKGGVRVASNDDDWGLSRDCCCCGRKANARLILELRTFGRLEHTRGLCAIHLVQVIAFIRAMQDFEEVTHMEADLKGGQLDEGDIDRIATSIAEQAGERVKGRIRQIREVKGHE